MHLGLTLLSGRLRLALTLQSLLATRRSNPRLSSCQPALRSLRPQDHSMHANENNFLHAFSRSRTDLQQDDIQRESGPSHCMIAALAAAAPRCLNHASVDLPGIAEAASYVSSGYVAIDANRVRPLSPIDSCPRHHECSHATALQRSLNMPQTGASALQRSLNMPRTGVFNVYHSEIHVRTSNSFNSHDT